MAGNKQLTCADYYVAWICPVADLELLPARLMLDEEHPNPPYDTHFDENTYICGSINSHAVVVATLPQGQTGNVNAGRLTGSMFKTFPNIRMAVLVGTGGGIPRPEVPEDSLQDVHLGDVVVGWPGDGKPACVYHDRGRAKVDGQLEMVGTMQDPDWRLTSALGILVSDHDMGKTTFDDQRARLQRHKKKHKFAYPGAEHDKLFKAAYRHAGDYGSKCVTCDQNELVQRPQRAKEDQHTLVFHQGRIATGNAVIQDGELRDKISARCDGALCVEIEAAGVDANRRCLVIRGISDYADSHKSDMWRSYAASNAAAFTRELLCRVQPGTVKEMEGASEAPWLVPLPRPPSFVGRKAQLVQLSAHISAEGCGRLAIYGLGGCGKTALALEAAYGTRERQPARAIFWVPTVSQESFEQAYREIGRLLRIPGVADAKANVKQLVKARLSDEGFGQWLMVVDNADDDSVLFGPLQEGGVTDRLIDHLPHSRKGSIVFTTRTCKAAVKLARSNHIQLNELDDAEAKKMLEQLVLPNKDLLEDGKGVHEFLELVTYLPLAIVQAVAFMVGNNTRVSEYMAIYRGSERDATDLLRRDFEDQGRYRQIQNPVAITWYISFSKIQEQDTLAAEYLSLMACTTGEAVPASLLWPGSTKLATTEALGTLNAYAFITERQRQQSRTGVRQHERAFDMHRLVRLATRNWLREHNQWQEWASKALARLVEVVPFGDYDTRETWTAYLPHAMHVVGLREVHEAEDRIWLLERVGLCEQTLGRYRAAEQALGQVLERREKVLGKGHPDTLASMNNLALVLVNQGKYAEAKAMHQETLALRKKVLGKEHPDTLLSINNLARVLSYQGNYQGKYAEAEAMHRETLALREKVLGKEHPDTLIGLNNMAITLSLQGKYAEAEAMYQETLALGEKVLGKEHPDTLASVYFVAYSLRHQHQYEEALPLYQRAFTGFQDALGPNHPKTRACLYHYASAQRSADASRSANERHELIDAVSEGVHSAPQGPTTTEPASRPKGQKRRRLKK
ncbi:kinesin light chain [Byssothecium circinans]|uniref:Kinesin light chain n=1 Tax=Byssothecium circinans TaxID=147558 RepID=A0A6A5TZV6_9PLEO|nr:kinesin light chain [Byssothecium circinans]